MKDTGDLSRKYCPLCEPDTDPTKEIVIVSWCFIHVPKRDGLDDDAVTGEPLATNLAEADGRDCKRFADFLRKRRKK